MRRSGDFAMTMRRGVRRRSASVVIHQASGRGEVPMVGFVVSKAVGNAVVRNRVKRRLRSIMAELVADLPPGCAMVVRALPSAGDASYSELREQVRRVVVQPRPAVVPVAAGSS